MLCWPLIRLEGIDLDEYIKTSNFFILCVGFFVWLQLLCSCSSFLYVLFLFPGMWSWMHLAVIFYRNSVCVCCPSQKLLLNPINKVFKYARVCSHPAPSTSGSAIREKPCCFDVEFLKICYSISLIVIQTSNYILTSWNKRKRKLDVCNIVEKELSNCFRC